MVEFIDPELFDIQRAVNLLFYIFVSFSFFIGVVLMVSPEAFDALNRALNKEYGIKTRLVPKVEITAIYCFDKVITKNRSHGIFAGAIIAIVSFLLILFY